MPDPTAPAGADDRCTCEKAIPAHAGPSHPDEDCPVHGNPAVTECICPVPLVPADFDPEPNCPIHGRTPAGTDDLRDRYARAIAQAIYRQPDPSWCLLDVCTPYANVVMAVRDEDLERLRAELAEEREANLANVKRLSELVAVKEGHLDLMTQMRDSERERADALVGERDALKAAIERVRALCQRSIADGEAYKREQGIYIPSQIEPEEILAALDTPDTTPETPGDAEEATRDE